MDFRICFKILCLVFKALHGQAPGYLFEVLISYVPALALRSDEKGLLVVPRVQTKKFGERAFAYAAPHLFNGLPIDIRLAKTLETFKNKLKTHFFRSAYDV